ncbi:dol-P-Glc:Glc(2)Man(9)GlcNAc(2)-PP-Dol alpha-1,2-glucosyltransferase [Halyomorpha halys]|uniref:dol-P-Glc:Glc(2)Man(9)GlcNAc(2)-PP-Dol alpha-1,2-glucosyltransferase n=1 Tax=Halyomorpha halys TaxID=286706 RepID=UPI0006D503DB|nr:putative Dol-P-Glc:Glc(2)Man(9)GlcNAc(2)-PP-Dol alpha-1,2-glucosyltransferase [Halyomorpha halys]
MNFNMLAIRRNLREKTIRKRIKQFYSLNLTLIYVLISTATFYFLNRVQPAPLIDEIFHIPQGISFIKGNFSEWNPKITTLPGLYLSTSAVFNIIAFVTDIPVQSLCRTYYLRLFNLVLSVFILQVVFLILTFDDFSTRKVLNPKKAFWVTLNISILPIAYFFNHFYYTDTFSTLLVLMMYRQHLLNNFGKAALLGICAVIARQTNIIWIGYLMIDESFHSCQKILRKKNSRSHHLANPIKAFRKLLEERLFKTYVTHFLRNSRCYFLVCLMFIVFVYFNKGIVVGDKDAHVPVIHCCQIFYFSLFMIIFGYPHLILSIKSFLNAIIGNKRIFIVSLIACLITIHFNTMSHPYLLADNRHYTFYFWKRIIEKHYLTKYILAPFYLFGMYAITTNLDAFKIVQFWACTCLCLVPQRLLELRYFIVPYIMLRLEISFNNSWSTAIETFWFVLINCLTLYIFATKEFYWSDSPAIQRIIW